MAWDIELKFDKPVKHLDLFFRYNFMKIDVQSEALCDAEFFWKCLW